MFRLCVFTLCAGLLACGPEEVIDTGSYDPMADPDNDGLSNEAEEAIGSDNRNPDTDGDGWNDGDEVNGNTDPLNPEDHPYTGGWDIGACRDGVQPTGSNVGDVSDDFGLVDQHGDTVTLHSFCDRVVLVVALQTTPYQEMDDVVDDEVLPMWEEYERDGLMVLMLMGPEDGVEPSQESVAEWAKTQGLTHPVLADVGWETTRRWTVGAEPTPPYFVLFSQGSKIAVLDDELDPNLVAASLGL